jgi:peptidylprolyl isomerase
MLTTRLPLPALLAALALVLAACGDDEPADSAAQGETATAEAPATTPPADPEAEPAAPSGGKVSKDLEEKPSIPQPTGEPPTELRSRDIVKGDGRTARKGDNVTVQYVGVNFSNGAEFDASWNSGQPFTFTLGSGQVIPGWDEGVAGMKVGGRRQLTIPPDMAYGPQGSPPAIGPNETLVFVIDLQKVESGQ